MDDSEIYICSPVDGIRKGKVQLAVLSPSPRKEYVSPEEIIDSGEYGDNEDESSDEIDAEYKEFARGRETTRRTCNMSADSSVHSDNYYQASKYYYEGSFQQSLELTVGAMDGCSNPRMRGHVLALATRCCLAIGDIEQAHQCANAHMHIAVDSVAALCGVGEVCLQAKQIPEALAWFARAVSLDVLNPVPRMHLAQVQLQNPTMRTECIAHLHACVTSCRITDGEYPPEQAIAMYLSVAEMLGTLGCVPELRIKALLRAVNVARLIGALQERRVSTVFGVKSIVRELQNVQVRAKAAEAFQTLGNLLQLLCPAAPSLLSSSEGYMQGAFAAYHMSNVLTDGNNVVYRSSLENISQIGCS